jgi:hypothetical protein
MSDYLEGHVKRDPVSGAVAIRTNQPEVNPPGSFGIIQAWLSATQYSGAHYLGTEVVDSWDDLFTPDPPEPPSA